MAGLPSQTCEAHGDNLISAVAGVNTVYCLQEERPILASWILSSSSFGCTGAS